MNEDTKNVNALNEISLVSETGIQHKKQFWKYYIILQNEVIGSVKLKFKGSELTILSLNIHPEFRGRKLSKTLLNEVIKRHGHIDLYIKPRPYGLNSLSREKLYEYYKSFGFKDLDEDLKLKRKGT